MRGAIGAHLAMTSWFLTAFTPSTPLAMLSAVLFSVALFANPESMTVPFSVSTEMDVGVDSLAVREFGLDLGRDRAVVDVSAGGLLAPVDCTARRREQYERRHCGGQGGADGHATSPLDSGGCQGPAGSSRTPSPDAVNGPRWMDVLYESRRDGSVR